MRVIKIGGNELDKPDFMSTFANVLHDMAEPTVVVHGGGKAVDELQHQLGQKTVKIQGMRRTDADTLRTALMVLCGLVGKQLAAALLNAGVDAVSMCGVDGGLLRVKKLEIPEGDLAFVGEITSVRDDLLTNWLQQGITPVISPISLGMDGQIYNVNADQAASAIAVAIQADDIDFVSNVPGVLVDEDILASLTQSEAGALISSGAINGGMVPKVQAALEVSKKGIPNVRIVDLAGLKQDGGTTFTLPESQPSHSIQS
jgi:acetylglutamate kinase